MNIYHVLYVGIGGFAGSIARYLMVSSIDQRLKGSLPFGTLTVNLLGSFALGLIIGFFTKRFPENATVTLALGTGFCGGFTTFSAFALENITLWHHKPSAALIYIAVSVIGGIAAVALGLSLGRAAS
jgi:fluoride exporter